MRRFWLVVLAVSFAFGVGIRASENSPGFEMPIRHYQIARLYGPGMKPSGKEGLHGKVLRKPLGRVGLVLVHTWNLGEEDGPYPIGTDAHSPGEAADWVPTAHEIVSHQIRPVLLAAREAGVLLLGEVAIEMKARAISSS